MTWADNVALAQLADRRRVRSALLPVGRWKGYGGDSNFNNRTFETLTWAAGLGAVTENIALLSTVHVPLMHPVAVAKQAATIDHITTAASSSTSSVAGSRTSSRCSVPNGATTIAATTTPPNGLRSPANSGPKRPSLTGMVSSSRAKAFGASQSLSNRAALPS